VLEIHRILSGPSSAETVSEILREFARLRNEGEPDKRDSEHEVLREELKTFWEQHADSEAKRAK
jgi:hypothetical protein